MRSSETGFSGKGKRLKSLFFLSFRYRLSGQAEIGRTLAAIGKPFASRLAAKAQVDLPVVFHMADPLGICQDRPGKGDKISQAVLNQPGSPFGGFDLIDNDHRDVDMFPDLRTAENDPVVWKISRGTRQVPQVPAMGDMKEIDALLFQVNRNLYPVPKGG
jgi:hypothetical protein